MFGISRTSRNAGVFAVLLVALSQAMALDLSTLTDAVVFTDVITAILAVAASIITVHIAIKAVSFVFRVLNRS